jgi:hypothetical protein
MRLRFTIRDLLWLTLVVGLLTAVSLSFLRLHGDAANLTSETKKMQKRLDENRGQIVWPQK